MRRLCKIQFLTFSSGKRAVFDPIAHLWDTCPYGGILDDPSEKRYNIGVM